MSGFDAHAGGEKKLDYWWTVLFTDPIAIPLSRFLAKRRWLTPDQVTILALVLGIAVGFFFYLGERWGLVVGGLVFYAAFIVDCVDGKLARALGVTSERGKALDALADGARRASATLGLFLYFWQNETFDVFGGRFSSGLELQLTQPKGMLAVAIYAVLAYYFLEISGAEKGDVSGGVRAGWRAALARRRLLPNPGMPDVQAIVFILGPITGLVVPALWVAIAMVTVAILLTVRRRLRTPA
jgi:phosphatidylserine synthase